MINVNNVELSLPTQGTDRLLQKLSLHLTSRKSANGNRISKMADGETTLYINKYYETNVTTAAETEYFIYDSIDRLVITAGAYERVYTYDTIGNMINRNGKTITWDVGNRPTLRAKSGKFGKAVGLWTLLRAVS
jgi:hypothetical protein